MAGHRCGIYPVPEPGPTRRVGYASPRRGTGPPAECDVLRPLEEILFIPVFVVPASEIPLSVDLPVLVVVADRNDDPTVADFMFCPAVHGTGRALTADQLETVADDLVYRSIEELHLGNDEVAQGFSSGQSPADAHVRNEQLEPSVDVPLVDRHRVSDGQLLDFKRVLNPSKALREVTERSVHGSSRQPSSRISAISGQAAPPSRIFS